VGGVTCYIVYSMIISSFDTTLPLHVREAFKWDSGPSGLMFLALQGPGILLGPLAGTLKDHIGTRCPAVIAFFIIGPSIWLMGLPEDERFPWFNNGERGQILYVICMILIGCMKPLLNSIGTLELTCKLLSARFQPYLYLSHW
jgi:MFS family permease